MKIKCITIILCALILSGCASDSKKVVDLNVSYIPTDAAPSDSSDVRAQAQLAQAAASVDNSLQELSQIQMATHPDVDMKTPVNPDIIGMDQITSLHWTGPIETLLKQIADISDYKVRVIGKAPGIPVIVGIYEENVTLANILRNATYQAAKQATIKVYSDTKTIELRYHSL